MKKLFAILFIVLLFLFICDNIQAIDASSFTWAEFSRLNKIDGTQNNVEVHIKNQEDLNKYLIESGNDLTGDMIWLENNENIIFPMGVYKFKDVTEFYLISSSGNIDFNNSIFAVGSTGGIWATMIGDQNNRIFENLEVYGSVNLEIGETGNGWYKSASNITHIGANSAKQSQGFYLQAFKASNMIFRNLNFNNSQNEGLHIFDIMDCDNITFEDITNRGYLSDWTQEELDNLNTTRAHTIYSELIQIDISLESSVGTGNFLSTDFKDNYWTFNDYSRRATKNTTIKNIRSTGYYGVTGQDIIDETNNKTYKPYSSTIGAHYVHNDAYTNILLTNNYFENSIYVKKNNLERKYSPIHFSILSQNISPTGSQEERVTKRENDAVYQATDININDSVFVNCYTEYEKVTPNDVNESECIGKKCKYSKWLADYSQEEHNITKINLVDDSNNIIKVYDKYIPEEPFIDEYVFISSSYDNNTGILTRKYNKVENKLIENIVNYDVDGNELESTKNCKLDSSEIISSTTETLPNGKSITVKNIKNIYILPTEVVEVPNTGVKKICIFVALIIFTIGIIFIFGKKVQCKI